MSPSGQVAGVAPGSTTITATSEGKSSSATITVTTIPVASVAISPATASLQVGQTVQLTATPKDSAGSTLTGRTVTWTSSNTSVAIVSPSGQVSGVTP
ncbi:MAG: Ig domain-containing protein, partial [Gemmatimonadetes bacterium]